MRNINLPSKKSYRTSITNKLRDEIRAEAAHYDESASHFLEIGCDQGYTTLSICDAFSKVTACDIDARRIRCCESNAQSALEKHSVGENITFVEATSKTIKSDHWDVVLIDALHTYKGVKTDFRQILQKNKAERFTVFFHDFWRLDFGVQRYIREIFKEDEFSFAGEPATWQPDRKITKKRSDYEAVFVRFDPELRKKVAERAL
ncbi:class I SAM-dependent methyltransferase [Candidatus Bathyarchaeota archaeon]|nr:class I SAM-dependent methyltransferase [Candidatus Bathyarchaeota archaeon]